MRFSNEDNGNNMANNQTDHDSDFQYKSNSGLDCWQNRFAAVTPTSFPLHFPSSSCAIIDASITGHFLIPSNGAILTRGIKLSTIFTLAYSLVLKAHADSLDEVIFAHVQFQERVDASNTARAASFVQHVSFDWNQTTLSSLMQLQNDTIHLASQYMFDAEETAIPTQVASLFRTILCFYPNSTVESELPLLGEVDYDLAFNIKPVSSDEIKVEIQYASRAITEPEVKAFLDHFGAAIENIPHNLTRPLSEISLVTSQEQRRLMDIYPAHMSLSQADNVTQLIEEQVRKTPRKVALQFDQDQFVTYDQLNSLANNVGHILISYGVKRGDLVGIYMDKSCEMFIAILGIHKAGGGYVPLDPAHPPERIQTILTIANIKIVLTHSKVQMQNSYESRVLEIDIHNLSAATKPDVCVSRDDISHVLFTSGSTGVPKGVILTHRSIIESCLGSREIIGGFEGRRVLQFSNYTFDVCVWDWGCTLISGGTLCVVPGQKLIDDLNGVARNLDATFLVTLPTVARLITPEEVPSLQMLVMGGEPLVPEIRDRWANEVNLMNVYGPTEASICVTAQTLVTTSTEFSDIGKPFGSNVIYVLDGRLRPVPLGCVGELYIGGPQLARGYLGNPEQTAKTFINDPFHPGDIMYASGDLVRISPVDHSIHYIGRRDTQVKIRGQRIEIGEIESVLKGASSVITNVAVIKVDVGKESLAAFLENPSETETEIIKINGEDTQNLVGTLRHTAQQRLPTYMIPAIYVPLNRFPLTSAGKLDRKALTALFYAHWEEIKNTTHLDSKLSLEVSSQGSPRNELQTVLRSIWASILNGKEESTSIDDNFFVVGGDSISAIRLASAARDNGIHLLATDVIQNPTIRAMAQVATQTAIAENGDVTVTLAEEDLTLPPTELLATHDLLPSDVLDVYPCTALQTSFLAAGLLIDHAYIVRAIYDIPFGSDTVKIKEAFNDFIDHPNGMMFRTIFLFDDTTSRFLQVVARPKWKRMEWMVIAIHTEAELEMAIRNYTFGRGCQKFKQGELLTRACIFELNGVPRALVWSFHHGLGDHWSLNNAEFDIADVYFRRTLPYRQPFKSMIKYLDNLDRTAGLQFWQNHLLDAKPTHFPQSLRDAPRSVINTLTSRKVHIDHTSFSHHFGITAASLVTAAWSVVVSVHTNSKDVVFGQVVSGRNVPIKNIDTMTGNTLNTVARRVTLKPEASVFDTLSAIQRDQIEITKHEHIHLTELKSQGTLAASLFTSLLNFANFPGDQEKSSEILVSAVKDSCLWTRRTGSYDGQDVPFALTVIPVTTEDFYLEASYNDEAIAQAEVNVILDHFENALRFMMNHPNKLIDDVELINDQEMKLLVAQKESNINHHDQNYFKPHGHEQGPIQSISQLIGLQVRRNPQRIALQFGQDVFLTYDQMDCLSNDLAHKLINNNVERGTLVALYMNKSIEMFLSIIAVHKAGGAFIPLDIAFPADRINTVVRLSQTTIVLTTGELHDRVASMFMDASVSLMVVDSHQLSHAANPNICVNPDDISHVLFTSGSTGIPKGVVLTHGAVIESCLGSREVIGTLDGQRVLQFSNYTFDPCIWDWCCTLISGGTLCFVPNGDLMEDLGGVARSLDITYLLTVPTVARLITPEQVPSLQMLVVGGELLTPEIQDQWADEVTLINIYGPTEASTCVTAQTRVTSSTSPSNIGRPFGLNRIYVLDERLRPVPLDCIGELFIGGPQLAREYLGNPEQTAKTFLEDPFRPGSIMYASGDLVRISPVDHSIYYLGRRDTQIKIRGQRVEIGEIESVLKGASSVITNAAVVKVDVGNESLAAFLEYPSETATAIIKIVPEDTHNLVEALRHAAQRRLPTYMIPATYVPLNRFPLTSSGKLDRKALTTLFYAHWEEIRNTHFNSKLFPELSSLEMPRDELQTMLRSLWASILNCQEDLLSIDDNFFIVGGDSISAIRLASAARDNGIHLLTTDVVQNPTIRAMAQVAQTAIAENGHVTLTEEDLTLPKELLSTHGLLPSDVLDVYPCTALQTSFLAAGLLIDHVYIVRLICDIPFGLDTVKIREAFNYFIDHPNGMMFRTIFLFDDKTSRFLQVVTRPTWRRMEWTIIAVPTEAELDDAVRNYAFGRGYQKFEQGELLTRVCVFELNGVPRALVWSFHHALGDHWSLNNAELDIANIYFHQPLPSRQPFKPMIKYLENLDRTAGLLFWQNHLLDAKPTHFPQSLWDAPRSVANTFSSRRVHMDHSSFAHQFGVTAASLVTAAWSVVVSVHANSTDVVFGQVVSGRNAPIQNIDTMTGITINTVARRVILKPDASILDTLLAIQQDQIEISKHEHIHLTELKSRGTPAADLFKSLLNFANFPGDQEKSSEVLNSTAKESCLWTRRTNSYDGQDVPFSLSVSPITTEDFYLEASYNDEAIAQAEVDVILDHFESALRFMMDHPNKLIDDVELINDQEMKLLVAQKETNGLAINHNDQNYSEPHVHEQGPVQNISQLIGLQVRRNPQRIALQFGHDVFLTYDQMDCLSNDLAHKLINSNVERGTLVALYMNKSIEMFLSIIAVHKAGGAFIPLDPEFPTERINTVVRLSQTTTVLTTGELHDQIASMLGSSVSLIVVDFQQLSNSPKPDVSVNRDDISHVLFTTGSTGSPKGVVLTHGSIIESCLGSRDVIGSLAGQRVLQFSNYTFDLCVWDWCCTLISGGTLCIVPKYKLLDDIGGVARSLDITYLGTTPTVARLITPEQVPSLQMLAVGGELLTSEILDQWADEVTLINMYGPTEASTCVTAQTRVTSSTSPSNIGRPFGLNRIYVLDERLRPAPLGCIGELFIGGPQVARGYLGNPEQTPNVFIKDPFHPGSVMYASGDLVQISPVDRSIYYLGRRDTQIKMHGQRVETGEIESVLKGASSVITNAAVVKVEAGGERLIAFVEYPSGAAAENIGIVQEDTDTNNLLGLLRQVAQRRLPTYMIPAIYIPLNRFPLTSSGKLDRKTLAEFFYTHQRDITVGSAFSSELSSQVPHNEVQMTLRSLWASTLNCEENSLSIDDDFFLVGGDSISVIKLASAARTAGLSILVADIIRNSTIRQMSQIIESAVPNHDYDDDETSSITLDQMSTEDLPLLKFTHDEFDSLRIDLLPEHNLSPCDVLDIYPSTALQTSFLTAGIIAPGAYVGTYAWHLAPQTDIRKLQNAFDDFINHPNGMMLRTVFVFHPVRNEWLQVLIKPGTKDMEWEIITVADETELDLRVSEYQLNERRKSFGDGILLTRGCIFKVNGYVRILVWSLHHALMDGWSMGRMTSDIQCLYSKNPLLPRRSFKPMIKYLQCLDHNKGIEFWRRHLGNASPTSLLQGRPATRRITTDATVSRDVQTMDYNSLIRRFGVMPSTLVTWAWAVVLSAHCGSKDVVFGQVLTGRNAPIKGIDSMTGIMINTVPRRVVLDPQASILETLRNIQSDQLEISKHEAISLTKLESEGVVVSRMFDNILNFRNRTLHGMEPDSLGNDNIFGQPKEGWGTLDYPLILDTELGSDNKILIHAFYASEFISEQHINGLLDHFESALRFMLYHPEKLIDEIELINEREMELLVSLTTSKDEEPLHSSNQRPTEPHEDRWSSQNVSELIELQVDRTPQRIALQFGHEVFLTYKQMDLLSNDLARKLIELDVKRGDLIALYMDKSVEMFLSILAVHKAGGAYVPLDPEFPADRINTIACLSQTTITLTTVELHDQAASMLVGAGVTLMVVDSQQLSHATKPDICVTRDDIAHVLFTSGSTGIPKGVVLTHGSVLEGYFGSKELIGSLDGQRVLQFSNYTFDLSVWDWTCTLISGGTLCFVPNRELLDDLGGVADNFDVTCLITTPTVAGLITPEEAPFLQMLSVGGELLTSEILDRWTEEATVINIYGPTEATCVTAQKRVTPSTAFNNIGRPFGSNVIYILDQRLRPVPLGCVGELYIGGPQVARGYLRNPEQTAKVFIEDPFHPGSIMYASGDLAQISPVDHSIHYLGRRDTQIKIRGRRMEIGEIESILRGASSAITNAVVVKADVGNEHLVAFLEYPFGFGADEIFIVHEDVGTLLTSLRHAAQLRLPSFMVPTVYIPLNRFPLSSSGKLDRKSLTAFFYAHQKEIEALRVDPIFSPELSPLEAPQNEVQMTLRSLWASILNYEEYSLSIDDDFILVGGDSISAARLASAARTAGLYLSVTDIIRNPTIRQMSQIIRSSVPDPDFEDDETACLTFDQMSFEDLPLLKFTHGKFSSLRNDLLPKYNLFPGDILDIYPSTALQTSFLIAGIMAPGSYIVAQAWDLPPQTDVQKLQKSFNDFVNHPNGMMLRTLFVFHPLRNEWLQVLIKPERKHMKWDIVTVVDENELDLRVSEYRLKGGSESFGDGMLLTRGCIFELNGYARVLVWTLHHAVMDGWSLECMMSDIRCVYSNHPLPLRRPFKPMIKYLQNIDHAAGVEFWRKHLKNASPTFLVQGHLNPRRVIADTILCRDMRPLGSHSMLRRLGIMPSTLVTCAWAMVLSAHTNATDIVFGQVLTGRNAPIKNIESMTGVMINTVARRVLFNPQATILETLRNIQSDQLEISKNEAISLAELELEGIPVSKMFNNILNFRARKGLGGREPSSFADDNIFGTPKEGWSRLDYPLALDVELGSSDRFTVHSLFASDLISEQETNVILDHFECALHSISDHPDRLISDVTLINDVEMRLLVPQKESINLAINRDDDAFLVQNLTELVQLQVKRTPQRIALQFGHDVFLTYEQMDLLSNDLARKLIKRDVKRGNLIALYMDKSVEMFLSILAVHKAGGAYVPLDPEFPAERVNTIVRLSQATIILTTVELHDQVDSMLVKDTVTLIVVDSQQLSHAMKPDVCVNREDVSHVLFTSGSTGIPKGVVLTHGSIIESCLGSRELIGSLVGQRVLQFSNYTFDPSVWDWACTLISGGSLCFVPSRRLLDDLGGVAKSLDITFLITTPTVARLITPAEAPFLQILSVGGELLTSEILCQWADEVTVINMYGPTEASTCVTAQTRVTPSTASNNIGRPFGSNVIYVLDERLRPVPLGCIGELYIGGPQVARGYLRNPEQTAKAFIEDPFHPCSIMYASGDLVRISPVDHSIHYLGRRDTQIKIRGQRMEVGEIESVLKGASSVITNAAVVKVDNEDERLVAFVEYYSSPTGAENMSIVHEGAENNNLLRSLRRAAQQRLPMFMIPTVYIPLNRFPLGSSGKLDRRSLIAFFHAHQEEIKALSVDSVFSPEMSSSEMPQNEVQVTLRSLWASILNCEEHSLSINDDFISVGGNSISATRLASAARTAGLCLSVTDILRNPTIRKMSQIVQSAIPEHDYDDDETSSLTLDEMSPDDLPLLRPTLAELDSLRRHLFSRHGLSASDVLDVYPATPTQTSFFLAGATMYDAYISSMPFDLSPHTDVPRLQNAFDDFINHPNGMMLRTVFVFHPVTNECLQILIRPGGKRMQWKIVTVEDETELNLQVSKYQLDQVREPFGDGMLLTRGCIFELNGYARALVWTLHHAVMDGWSVMRMMTDLQCVYSKHPLPPRRPFKPMIKYLQSVDHTAGIEFWRKHLKNASPTFFLQRRPTARWVTDSIIVSCDMEIVNCTSLTRHFGIMLSTLVTCAWAMVLSAHTSATDVVFGQVLAGRNVPIKDIESMTGIMINLVARRVVLSPTATVIETLRQVQRDQFEINRHENISLSELHSKGIPVYNLFNSAINFRTEDVIKPIGHDNLAEDRLFVKLREGAFGGGEYPFALDAVLRADLLSITFAAASEFISESAVRTILGHFEYALRFIVEHPERPISEIITHMQADSF